MGRNIAEKILLEHCDAESIAPGDLIHCCPDLMMGHDLTVPHAINVFRQIGMEKVKEPGKLVFVQDHFQPAKDLPSAELGREMREFAKEQKVGKYFEVGRGGICHILMLEQGLVRPGMFIAGADSHTSTAGAFGAFGYCVGATELAAMWALGETWIEVPATRKIVLTGKPGKWVTGKDIVLRLVGDLGQEGAIGEVLEFSGDTLESLPVADLITIANMSAETGATSVIIPPNRHVIDYLLDRSDERVNTVEADPDAEYVGEHTIDVEALTPLVAAPPGPANVMPVEDLKEIEIDQVFLGSCTNGSIEDFRRFAEVVGDRNFASGVRMLAIPATQETYLQALREGILNRIVEAGGAIQTPGCGPCVGAHAGVLAAGEVCLSTSNRNFRGRMGHAESLVYLSGVQVAAASAITGRITHPVEVTE